MQKKYFLRTVHLLISTAIILLLTFGCATHKPVAPKTDYDVIIIGAGMGGLSSAANLACNDLKVLVLEQHDKVSGCTTNFQRGDFTFDASLHEMAGGGPGKNDRALYTLLEVNGVGEKVELSNCLTSIALFIRVSI
jgi:NAD(P)-binding Rossmann-like domain